VVAEESLKIVTTDGWRRAACTFRIAVATVLLTLAACNAQLVYDPTQPVQPNPLDRTEPDLQVRVYFDANTYDTVVKPQGTIVVLPYRCFHVSNPFRVLVTGSDLEGGISYLGVGSYQVAPIISTIVATPAPDFTTQVDDPVSPNVTYPNPGVFGNSHRAEVTYYTGATPPGRPRGLASLSADFNFAGNGYLAITAWARNTSVSAISASMDAYFVRPADGTHPPGSVCTPPP
jgi:hypothetical protein